MGPWRDALQIAADLLEQDVAADVLAARDTIARAAAHAATCEACAGLDQRLLADAFTALDSWTVDADLNLAALELAVELDHRLTTHQVQPSARPLTSGDVTASHAIAHPATPQNRKAPR